MQVAETISKEISNIVAERVERLKEFWAHEETALREVGQAVLAFIPQGVREHGQNALDESTKGFGVLAGMVEDDVKGVVRTIRGDVVRFNEDGTIRE